MNFEQAKELLTHIIDSEAKWEDIYFRVKNAGFYTQQRTMYKLTSPSNYVEKDDPWWATREAMRIKYGIYEMTEITTAINNRHAGIFAHVSQEDKSMIAYTVDGEAGKRDKQLKIAPGRLLRKLFPLYSDDYINELVAMHLGEACAEVEYLTTYDDIYNAYCENLDSSCMTVGKVHVNGDKHPPALVFCDHPVIKLAVLRHGSKIIARTFVRTDTKKYIRVYGNKKIKTALEKLGYEEGTFVGLELNTVQLKHSDISYAMPYLDGNDARGSEDTSTVALIDNKIFVISPEIRHMIKSNNLGSTATALNTSGWVQLPHNIESTVFEFVDCISGETVNVVKSPGARIYTVYRNEETGKTVQEPTGLIECIWHKEGQRKMVYAEPSDTFYHSRQGVHYIDNEFTRNKLGYVKLDERFYPEERGWVNEFDCESNGEGTYIKKSDSVTVLTQTDKGCTKAKAHKSEITKQHIKLHSIRRGEPVYAAPGTEVVKTVFGRKVIPSYYGVVKFADTGEWDFINKAKSKTTICDVTYFFASHYIPEDYLTYGKMYTKSFIDNFNSKLANTEEMLALMVIGRIRDTGWVYQVRGRPLKMYMSSDYHTSILKDLAEDIDSIYMEEKVKAYIKALLQAYKDRCYSLAEAKAVEYPNKARNYNDTSANPELYVLAT